MCCGIRKTQQEKSNRNRSFDVLFPKKQNNTTSSSLFLLHIFKLIKKKVQNMCVLDAKQSLLRVVSSFYSTKSNQLDIA